MVGSISPGESTMLLRAMASRMLGTVSAGFDQFGGVRFDLKLRHLPALHH